MSAALLDRPAPADLDLDLRGLDYYTRRQQLFAALRRLRATEGLRVTSTPDDDLYWLRYEMEARTEHRYRWSLAGARGSAGVHTLVRLPD